MKETLKGFKEVLSFLKFYAVEILSIVMGIWLLWITIIYSFYIRRLRKKNNQHPLVTNSEEVLRKARNERKRTYAIAVRFPSYLFFWVVVAIWGLSFMGDYS